MSKVGMIGLGEMGSAFVRRLFLAKREVVGYNRTKAKAEPLIKEGLHYAATPREVVEQCDIVLCMVTDDKAIAAVTEGPDGALAALRPGKIFVEMSAISPKKSRKPAPRSSMRRSPGARSASNKGNSSSWSAGTRRRSSKPSRSCATSAQRSSGSVRSVRRR